jgi:ATP-dependent helicase/nuclease subunit A
MTQMTLTPTQRAAISASGNVVVIAGAGTGKTRTLVERCLELLLHSTTPVDLSEMLVVTFTEAAAAEMRHRLRDRLQEYSDPENAGDATASSTADVSNSPARRQRSQEQLALFETANIGTLHSFCLELARRHFYLLELDPQFTVMSEEEARLLAHEQLDVLFAEKYSEKTPEAEAVRELIASHGDGSDQTIRALVLRLHEYGQTLPNPDGWMKAQLTTFEGPVPAEWRGWLDEGLTEFQRDWRPRLERMAATNGLARECLAFLESSKLQDPRSIEAPNSNLQKSHDGLAAIIATREKCPTGKKTAWLQPLEPFYKDAAYLLSLTPSTATPDPLAEDWSWLNERMRALLELASEFTERFSRAKRDLALADFHDLEQFALRLLWNNAANGPTKIAEQWRATFGHVMVDEYQDINAAQDQILRALSRDGPAGNRFLVGDLKQSIYRFRLAAPRIFQAYTRDWVRPPAGTVIPLNENFRSRERILDFVNSVFELLMIDEVGGLTYQEDARLRFGAATERRLLAAESAGPRVELHFRKRRSKGSDNGNDTPEGESFADLEEAAKEARLVALRLRELHGSKHEIWDDKLKVLRPVKWNDMAILLRSPARKTEFYVREFARLDVPVAAARGGFYDSTEISDILSLLTILDNPLQDLPLLAVLRSPIVGLSLEELAQVRVAAEGPFWNALLRWEERAKREATEEASSPRPSPPKEEREKAELCSLSSQGGEEGIATADALGPAVRIRRFLERFARWRTFTRQMSLSSCLEEILSETRYPDWLLTQSRGEERLSNLQGFVNLARKFDQFQRQGLLRFLLFVEAQRSAESEPPVPSVIDENAVRLMSIHQSKGLEFPVVLLADTAKPFNLQDLKSEIILDDVYGICPLIKPPESAKRYPSLPYWLARRRQRKEILGEELRLLYVAMTRARDTLILTASVSESWERRRLGGETMENGVAQAIVSARSVADWIALWFSRHTERTSLNVGQSVEGELHVNNQTLARWTIHDSALASERGTLGSAAGPQGAAVLGNQKLDCTDEAAAGRDVPPSDLEPGLSFLTDPIQLRAIEKKLTWSYPYPSATRQTAKSSVSVLRREAAQKDEESVHAFNFQPPAIRSQGAKAADAGIATHTFLQRVSLDNVSSVTKLQSEVARLVKGRILTSGAAGLIDVESIGRFWQSPLGTSIRSQAKHVQRELAFTARISLGEIASILHPGEASHGAAGPTNASRSESVEEEFVIIQGIADVVLLLPETIQIIDFKTDKVSGKALTERAKQYEPQLKLYSLALSRIYKRPVSSAWLYFLTADEAVKIGP